jgi:hypothetical protein
MKNKFQSADSFKFKHTLTGASGHFDALFVEDNLSWQDTKPRMITGHGDHIYHYGKRLLKEGDAGGIGSAVLSSSASGIRIEAHQANFLNTGDIVRFDAETNFYVKAIASGKGTADAVGVVDFVSGTHDFLKDSSSNGRQVNQYYAVYDDDVTSLADAVPTLVDSGNYKYGTSSASFQQSGFLRAPYNGLGDNFYLDSGDFTIEFWFNADPSLTNVKDKDGVSRNQIILTDFDKGTYSPKAKGTGSFEIELSSDRSVKARFYKEDKTLHQLATPNNQYLWNTWNHVTLQRSGTDISLWFNGSTGGGGQRVITIGAEDKLYDSRPTSSGLTIGKAAENWQKDGYSGFLEEVRHSAQARYTGIFKNDLPLKHFTSDSNTRLLMHFDSGNAMFRYVGHGWMDSLTGLSPGNVYFLSSITSGGYDKNESYGVGDISKPIFTALSENTAYVHNYRGIEITQISDTYYVKMAPIPPATNVSYGQKGMVSYDDHYWYACIGDNHWKRTAIGDW